MHLPETILYDAKTLEEAADLAQRHGPEARFLAGGTDLFVDLKTERITATHLISLRRIASLHGIEETADGLRIGALTTVSQLDRSDIVRKRFRPLIDATSQMAVPQVRNSATVGGNIASAVPCADLPPILVAMNASVAVWSGGTERIEPLDSFIVDVRQTKLQAGDVLTAVLVPNSPRRFGAAYSRFSLRDGNAIAVAGVAAGIQLGPDGAIQDARVVLGAVSPMPVLVQSAATALIGRQPDEQAWSLASREAGSAARPICDVRGSAEFRREIVTVMAKRALREAFARAQGGQS